MTKVELRQSARQAINRVFDERYENSRALVQTLIHLPCYRAARTVGLFAPLRTEPDIETVWAKAPRVFCYPRLEGEAITLIRVASPGEVDQSPWNRLLREPAPHPGRVVPLAEVDLLLVPGLAFTRAGQRLGRGGGCYDRLLAQRTGRTFALGICFEVQVVDDLPFEAHDQAVDAVLTERGLLGGGPI